MKEEKTIYVFMGPPGSGKGSLAKLCIKKFGWYQLSTGNLCRQHIERQTEIGKQIDFAIKSGKLISDNLVVAMVQEWLIEIFDETTGIILDGFPRTVAQAEALDTLIATTFDSVSLNLVKLVVPNEEIVDRLSGRYICRNNRCQAVYSLRINSVLRPRSGLACDECSDGLVRRSDDEAESVRERLKIYYAHEQDLLKYYHRRQHDIAQVDGTKTLDRVFEKFEYLINRRKIT